MHIAAHREYEEITRILLINRADMNIARKRRKYTTHFNKYHGEVGEMPRDYDSEVTKNHGTRGQMQVRRLLRRWLLKLRAGEEKIKKELLPELGCISEEDENYETEIENELDIIKNEPTVRQSVTLWDMWRALKGQMRVYCRHRSFKEILDEKMKRLNNFNRKFTRKLRWH